MHPVLFLSYDGCLHPEGVRHGDAGPQLRDERHTLFEHAELLARLVVPYPELRIVLSTPWTRICGFERAKEFLPAALRTRVIGTTHEFCGDFVEWCELTEFDQIMRYVEGHSIQTWLALSCDKYYWPEAFRRNRVWVYNRAGLGEDRATEELIEKLKQMHRESLRHGSVLVDVARDANAIRMRLDAATTKLADARIPELSASTRFQAAYDALYCCASIMMNDEPQSVGLHLGQILERLSVEHQVDNDTKAHSIALLEAWQTDNYWEPRVVKPSDVDVVLKFAEAVLSAKKSRMQET